VKSKGTAARLEKLGLRNRFDFILHLPLRYEDETVLTPVADAPAGRPVLVQARVQSAKIAFRPKRQLVVQAEGLSLRFFNFYGSQLKQFQRAAEQGLYVRAYGEVRGGWAGREMAHPRYRIVGADEPLPDALTPIYPTTAGLPQAELRIRVLQALDADVLVDSLPVALLRRYDLAGFADSVQTLHRPPPGADLRALGERTHPAWRRMKFDELLAQQLSMRFAYQRRRSIQAPSLPGNGPLVRAFMAKLPFKLTRAQARALNQVLGDLREPHPMQRLIQGDVGSGKTIVAGIACLAAIDAGWQAAVMAPTEILSEQHYRKFRDWFDPLSVRVGWLHGGVQKKARAAVMESQIVVGTHALIQDSADFTRLGLAVVDEQHRFGVRQRLDLRRKAEAVFPHQLMMSATPIPRTLSMTYYADLDVSVINEMPPGRRPVVTRVFTDERRADVLERVREACAEGQQAYWVCPVIEESKEGDVQTALDTYDRLHRELKTLRIGLIHGRMPPTEKAAAMADFAAGKIQLFVCTTVIEVGVDVPNASLMVIESAERFGLAQLHQLRGRIGRGSRDSVCVLLYSGQASETARQRLTIMKEHADGFRIADLDLKLRGPGEYIGERQSGQFLRFADLERDDAIIDQAKAAAAQMLEEYPDAARAHVTRWMQWRQDLSHA
jgi:ATP-dependent DNA helicase RecG